MQLQQSYKWPYKHVSLFLCHYYIYILFAGLPAIAVVSWLSFVISMRITFWNTYGQNFKEFLS